MGNVMLPRSVCKGIRYMAIYAGFRVAEHEKIIPRLGILKEELSVFIGRAYVNPIHIHIIIFGTGCFLIEKSDILQWFSVLAEDGKDDTVF